MFLKGTLAAYLQCWGDKQIMWLHVNRLEKGEVVHFRRPVRTVDNEMKWRGNGWPEVGDHSGLCCLNWRRGKKGDTCHDWNGVGQDWYTSKTVINQSFTGPFNSIPFSYHCTFQLASFSVAIPFGPSRSRTWSNLLSYRQDWSIKVFQMERTFVETSFPSLLPIGLAIHLFACVH